MGMVCWRVEMMQMNSILRGIQESFIDSCLALSPDICNSGGS